MDSRALVDQLTARTAWTYQGGRVSAAEPAAWSALALAASGRLEAALAPAQWLSGIQQADGAVGVSADQPTPQWPTSLAVLAWQAANVLASTDLFGAQIESATRWILDDRGKTAVQKPQIGHDTSLVGWSWAANTHSWLEPTCFAVMALKAVGLRNHARTREGVRLIVNRILPSGGANYGNTIVLGQELLPHLHSTGIVMVALADEKINDPRIDASLTYLAREIQHTTGAASLCHAMIGLTAYGRRPDSAERRVDACIARYTSDQPSAHTLALAVLARRRDANWLPSDKTPSLPADDSTVSSTTWPRRSETPKAVSFAAPPHSVERTI